MGSGAARSMDSCPYFGCCSLNLLRKAFEAGGNDSKLCPGWRTLVLVTGTSGDLEGGRLSISSVVCTFRDAGNEV